MKKKLIYSALLTCSIFSSCNDDILEKVNPNQLSLETYYKTGPQIIAASTSVYATLQGNNLYNREYFFLQDLLSDDCASGGPQLETPRAQTLEYTFDGSNKLINDVWQGLYRVIHRANLVIEYAPKATQEVTDELKNRIVGEAKFLRAWAYFDLVSLWGRVPLMTQSAIKANALPRAQSEDEIYNLIFADLADAEAALPASYDASNTGRATKGAAQALAGRAYLFRGEYAKAKEQLMKVYGKYKLVDRYLDNFQEDNENNAESIFEVQFSEASGTADAWNGDGSGIAEITFRGQEYGPTSWRNVLPSQSLADEFEKVSKGAAKDDPRYSYSFFRVGDTYNNGTDVLKPTDVQGDVNKVSWKKYQMIYKRKAEDMQSGINFRVIRYADVLLMLAECENELSGPAAALPYMNEVRGRKDVAMPPYPTAQYPCSNKDETLQAIMHERRVELGGEQIRNRDIRRWRKLGKLKTDPISNFQKGKHELLPLPTVEIDNNAAIEPADQNPGY